MFKEEITNKVMTKVFDYMLKNNLNQFEVSKKAGISRSHFNSMINGKRFLNAKNLYKIENALGIKVNISLKVEVC